MIPMMYDGGGEVETFILTAGENVNNINNIKCYKVGNIAFVSFGLETVSYDGTTATVINFPTNIKPKVSNFPAIGYNNGSFEISKLTIASVSSNTIRFSKTYNRYYYINCVLLLDN